MAESLEYPRQKEPRPKGLTDSERMVLLVERVVGGESVNSAVPGTFGDRRSLCAAMSQDSELRKLYDEALRLRADFLAEETIEISDELGDPQRQKNRIESRKWWSGCMKPRVYGPKIDVNIQTEISCIDAMREAESRIWPRKEPIEDAEIVDQSTLPGPRAADAPLWPDIFS